MVVRLYLVLHSFCLRQQAPSVIRWTDSARPFENWELFNVFPSDSIATTRLIPILMISAPIEAQLGMQSTHSGQ